MNDFDDLFENKDNEQTNDKPKPLSHDEWIEKKRLDKEEAYSLLDTATGEMTANGESFRQLLKSMCNFNRYSPGNILLISYQMPDATNIADFDSWKDKGAKINKGEKAITILEPGKEFKKHDGNTGININVKKVFDISQTDCSALVDDSKMPAVREALKALIASAPCKVTLVDDLHDYNARYDPRSNVIYVARGIEPEDMFRTLAFEIGIAKYSQMGIDRNEASFPSYCAAFIICERYGIDTEKFSFDKVSERFADKEPKEIRKTVGEIKDSANDTIKKMINELNRQSDKGSKDHEAR